MRAENTSGVDTREWQVEVRCERRTSTVGCGCQSFDVTLLVLGALHLRQRQQAGSSARKSSSARLALLKKSAARSMTTRRG